MKMMPRVTNNDIEVFRPVISLVTIDVVNNFSRIQAAANLLLCHDTMLVGISTAIRKVMLNSNPNQNVAVGCFRPPSPPIAVALTSQTAAFYTTRS